MKKTLAAAAVLSAMAAPALAADVTVYGMIDTSLVYRNIDDGSGSQGYFSMETGQQAPTRWGIKGSEKIDDNLTVSFILENGFNSDDGGLSSTTNGSNTMFGREATLSLSGSWGKISIGRLGSVNNGTGSWAKMARISAFGTSWFIPYGTAITTVAFTPGILGNMIAYQTPDLAGLKVYAQYSMNGGTNGATGDPLTYGTDNKADSNRYWLVGATYDNGPFSAYLMVDSLIWSHDVGQDVDDAFSVTAGVSYDFGVAKVILGGQYYDNWYVSYGLLKGLTATSFSSSALGGQVYLKGYGVALTASIPFGGGTIMAGLGYMDGESADNTVKKAGNTTAKDLDFKRYNVSVGYDYKLSKRTNVYTILGYMKDELTYNSGTDRDVDGYGFTVGMRHVF